MDKDPDFIANPNELSSPTDTADWKRLLDAVAQDIVSCNWTSGGARCLRGSPTGSSLPSTTPFSEKATMKSAN